MYTGTPISLEMLFGGLVEIDHVLPYSKTLDDSFWSDARGDLRHEPKKRPLMDRSIPEGTAAWRSERTG